MRLVPSLEGAFGVTRLYFTAWDELFVPQDLNFKVS